MIIWLFLSKIYIILIMKTLKTDIAKNWGITTSGKVGERGLRDLRKGVVPRKLNVYFIGENQ